MNYYSILGIVSTASTDEIKKAFRTKLKKNHPDIQQKNDLDLPQNNKTQQHENLVTIINAYSVLSNPIKRKHYDLYQSNQNSSDTYFYNNDAVYQRSFEKKFNYVDFLLARQDQWNYKIKLFLYDLVFARGDRAKYIYEEIVETNNKKKLQETIGFLDYFDCMFLMAEYYQNISSLEAAYKSLELYYEIILLEEQRAYFKSYMEEVCDRIFNIIHNFSTIEHSKILSIINRLEHSTISPKQKKIIKKFQFKD